MKHKVIITCLLLICLIARGQAVFEWAKVGEKLGNFDGITSDASGNIYQERFNTFSKYNSLGNLVWEKLIDQHYAHVGIGTIIVSQNTIHISGSIYLEHGILDSIDFDPGPGKAFLTANERTSSFVAKYDIEGNFIWVKKIESYSSADNDFSFIKTQIDNSGNIYASEIFRGTVDFDPGPGVFTLHSSTNTVYLAKYNSSGNFLFAKKIDNNEDEGMNLSSLVLDNSTNIYLNGRFKGTSDFDLGSGTANRTAVGDADAFIAKYDMNGNLIRSTNWDDNGAVYSNLATDVSGNIYLSGSFYGTVDFDHGSGNTTFTAVSEFGDPFMAKYNSSGNLVWAKQSVGGGGALDEQGDLYNLSGRVAGTFFSKYSDAGNLIWEVNLGFIDLSYIVVGFNQTVFLSGAVSNLHIADLDPGPGDYTIIGPEREGTHFFAKYSEQSTLSSFITDRSQWKYLDNGSNQGTAWRSISFNDATWKTGIAALGDNGFENTLVHSVGHPTTYFRKKITVSDKAVFSGFNMSLMRDDGAVVYVNGLEVWRSNMPAGTINNSTLASSGINPPNESQFIYKVIPVSAFTNGDNEIALEIHQASSNFDISFNMKLSGIKTVPGCTASGNILREYWAGIPGKEVSLIPVNTSPTSAGMVSIFEGPSNAADSYGSRIRGFICPPYTGYYTFWIASDDNSELWLSTDTNKTNKVKIASLTGWAPSRDWNKFPSQKSSSIYLVAGNKYYIEALHKENNQGDNIAVGWQLPDGIFERPIPGKRLSPISTSTTSCPTVKITPLGPTTFCSGSVTLQSSKGSGYVYQWKKDGVDISGATNSSYTATVSGSYQVKVIHGPCIVWSAPISVKKQSGLSASITPGGPTTFCTGGNVKLFGNTCAGYTYKWKKDGSYITGATGATCTAATTGNYQLQVTQAGVNAWSAQLKVSVNACRGSETDLNEETDQVQSISEFSDSLNTFQMKVYPNPNTGLFTIVLNMPLNEAEKVNMKILNIVGQEVYNKEYLIKDNYFKETVDLDQSLPTGIYTLQIIIGNKVENTNVVLLR